MKYKIIVSRFNEDINWLNSETENCIICNKGERIGLKNEIMLPNVGRESETYLNYIIKEYQNLPELLIFTQGSISQHQAGGVNYLLKIAKEAEGLGMSKPTVVHPQGGREERYWGGDFNFVSKDYELGKLPYLNNKKIKFSQWFEEKFDIKYPNPIYISKNGIFAVKKSVIIKNRLSMYQDLIKSVNYSINPIEGHFFERSWHYLFNTK